MHEHDYGNIKRSTEIPDLQTRTMLKNLLSVVATTTPTAPYLGTVLRSQIQYPSDFRAISEPDFCTAEAILKHW